MASADPKISKDVAAFTKDFKRLQQQKHRMRGGVEARMLIALGMYYGEMYMQQVRDSVLTRPLNDDDRNKLFLVFNLLKKASRRKIGRLWAAAGVNQFHATPDIRDPKALDQAQVVSQLLRGLSKKLKEKRQHWLRLFWTVNTGVCIEHTPWVEDTVEEPVPQYDEQGALLWRDAANPDPNATMPQAQVEQMVMAGNAPERFTIVESLQLIGDVGSEVLSGFNFFIDSSVPTIDALGPDQACHIMQVKTVDWAREMFGSQLASQIQGGMSKDLGIVKTRLLDRGPAVAGLNLKDLIPAIQGSQGPDDPEMFLFGTRYQPACQSWPHGRRSMWSPNGPLFDDGPTEYGEIPLTDFHYGAPATTFWSDDFLTDLVPANKFLNKRMSQLGESANAQIYEVLRLGPELSKADIPSDMPGIIEDGLGEDGSPRVDVMQRGQLPSFFLESIKLVIQLFQQMSSVDLTDHQQYPGQLRGPMALPLLQEIVDSEDGPLYEHLGEQLALVHQQRINRVKQFYPPIRTLHYTGDNRKDEVLVFHTEQILRAGTEFSISVDPGSLLPEFSALREARIIERLSGPLAGLYVNRRTGRLDFSKVASEIKYNDDDIQDRQTQYRELSKHLIARLWQGETLPPEVPYPFWDHDAMLDELEAAMATTEFLEASTPTKQNFIALYERCRQFLAAIQDAQMQAVQGQMNQGLMAQVSQQVAAKVAAQTADQALGQINAQAEAAKVLPPAQALAQAMAANRSPQQGMLARGGPPVPPGVH